MSKAIGYIRGRKWNGRWSEDTELQKQQIAEYAEEKGISVVGYYADTFIMDFSRSEVVPRLRAAISRAKQERAQILYVHLGKWRPNFVLNDFEKKRQQGRKQSVRLVRIPPERATLEALERQDRIEKYWRFRQRTQHKPVSKKKKDTELEVWRRVNAIPAKRFANLKHLYDGVRPIYKVIEENSDKSAKAIADILHQEAYFTVAKKRWFQENVRKARAIIASDEFREYVAIREREKAD